MPVVLALLSALALGSADFVGGLAAKRARAAVVVIWSNAAGLLVAIALVVTALPGRTGPGDLLWGGLAGISGSVGAVLLYRALARGVMAVVAPVSAAAAAAIPVGVGLASGERLSGVTAVGVVAALVAVVLITRTPSGPGVGRPMAGVVEASLAGLSFGVFLVLLAHSSADSSLWPLAGARCASLSLLVAVAVSRRTPLTLPPRPARFAVMSGGLDMAANVFFLVAVRGGDLAVVGLLASLSPLGTVVLARLLLHERIRTGQRIGAALALGSVMLLAFRS